MKVVPQNNTREGPGPDPNPDYKEGLRGKNKDNNKRIICRVIINVIPIKYNISGGPNKAAKKILKNQINFNLEKSKEIKSFKIKGNNIKIKLDINNLMDNSKREDKVGK